MVFNLWVCLVYWSFNQEIQFSGLYRFIFDWNGCNPMGYNVGGKIKTIQYVHIVIAMIFFLIYFFIPDIPNKFKRNCWRACYGCKLAQFMVCLLNVQLSHDLEPSWYVLFSFTKLQILLFYHTHQISKQSSPFWGFRCILCLWWGMCIGHYLHSKTRS